MVASALQNAAERGGTRSRIVADTAPIKGVSLGKRLAIGGMGELHLAQRSGPNGDEPCVVKRLLPNSGALERTLFGREARALASLTRLAAKRFTHLIEAGPSVDEPEWLVLEWVDGVDLHTLLAHRRRRGRPLPLPAALVIVQALAEALLELAQAVGEDGRPLGLVHRDLHPGNVLIARDGEVKVIDLGVATFVALDTTSANPKGTLAFMAPEQLRAGVVSPASDLYAVGLIAYEVVCGEPARPPESASIGDLLAYRSALPPAPSHHRPDVPAELDTLLLEALAVDPAARPTPERFLERLQTLIAQVVPSPMGTSGAVDTSNLAAIVAPLVVESPVRSTPTLTSGSSPSRSLGAESEDVPAESARPPASRRRRWSVIALGGLTLAAAAIVVTSTVSAPALDGGVGESPTHTLAPTPTTAPTTTPTTAPTPTPTTTPTPTPTPAPTPTLTTTPTPTPTPTTTPTPTPAPTPTTTPTPTPTPTPAPTTTPTPTPPLRPITIRPTDGPVHVSAGGRADLAPFELRPTPGTPLLMRLTGGSPPMSAVVRVIRDPASSRLSATLGAPPGEVHQVACGSRPAKPTPLPGLSIPSSGVTCRITATDGRAFAFTLLDAPL